MTPERLAEIEANSKIIPTTPLEALDVAALICKDRDELLSEVRALRHEATNRADVHDDGYACGYFDALENRGKSPFEKLTFSPNPYREE